MGRKENFDWDVHLKRAWEWVVLRYRNPKLANFLTARIAKIHRERYACIRRFRFAEVGNQKDMEAYEKTAAEDCCDSFECEFTFVDHEDNDRVRRFRYGFNYGH